MKQGSFLFYFLAFYDLRYSLSMMTLENYCTVNSEWCIDLYSNHAHSTQEQDCNWHWMCTSMKHKKQRYSWPPISFCFTRLFEAVVLHFEERVKREITLWNSQNAFTDLAIRRRAHAWNVSSFRAIPKMFLPLYEVCAVALLVVPSQSFYSCIKTQPALCKGPVSQREGGR